MESERRAADGAHRHGTDVLIRKVDSHLAAVRAGLRGADLELAERVAAALRALVRDTTQASAADRARVRAAVHFFVLRREGRGPLPPVRSLAAARQMVNKVVLRLGRPDLVVSAEAAPREDVPGASPRPAVPVPGTRPAAPALGVPPGGAGGRPAPRVKAVMIVPGRPARAVQAD